jgi:hypothetical protein
MRSIKSIGQKQKNPSIVSLDYSKASKAYEQSLGLYGILSNNNGLNILYNVSIIQTLIL